MFEASPEIYNNVGRFPSFQDMEAQRQTLAANRLHQLILQHQISQQPVADQLQQLQLATGQIGNQKANMLLQLLGRLGGGAAAAPGTPLQKSPVAPMSAPQMPADPTPGTPGSMPPQAMPAAVNAPHATPGAPALGGLGFNDITALHALGGPDLLPAFKFQLEGVSHPAGAVTTYPDGRKERIATLDAGQNQDMASEEVTTTPGYAKSKGEITGAVERGKNAETLLPPTYTSLGQAGQPPRPVGGSIDAFLHPQAPGAPAAGAPPVAFDQLSPGGQQDAMADMAARGQDPRTMKVNGAPAFGGMQEQLDAAKAGGPNAIAQFYKTIAPRLGGDPRKMAGLMYDLHTPPGTPIHSMGGGAAPAAGAAPVLAGPADIASATLAAEQAVHATTDAPIQLGKDLVVKSHDANQKFVTDLGSVVNNEGEIVARNTRLQPLLSQLPSLGGFGQDQRINFANQLKHSGILPQSTLDSLSAGLAGGDPDAAKAVQNQLSAAAIQTMLDTLNKEGKPNRVMYQALHEQQEGLAAGKPVLQAIMDLQKQLYEQHIEQYTKATDLMASPNYNPIRFGSQFATAKSQSIADPTPVATPAAVVTPADVAAILRKHGVK